MVIARMGFWKESLPLPSNGLPAGETPLIPAGSEVRLRLVIDDASGQINGRDVLTMAVVSVKVDGKSYEVATVRMAKPPAPTGAKWAAINAFTLPASAIGEHVRVPA